MEVVTSLDNKNIKAIAKLKEKKYRDIESKFLVEGEHLVEEAFKSGNLLSVCKTPDYVRNFPVDTTIVSYDVIKKLSSSVTPQKVVGICKKVVEKEAGNRIVILDGVQDPGNLGTIIRSCVAFSIDTIVVSNDTVDVYNDKVLRSSEGMLFYVNILKRDVSSYIDSLHKAGYKVMGTKVTGGSDIGSITKPNKFALVMGNEGNGVKSEILDKCDQYIYIKMSDICESLNVGVATSILLYELNK